MIMQSKKNYDVWLVGKTIKNLDVRKKVLRFVSCRDVLKLFFKHYFDCGKRKKYQIAKEVARDVLTHIKKIKVH